MHIRVLDRRELSGFAQYLLPEARSSLQRGDTSVLALGAVQGMHSCGAAAARIAGDEAVLTDLFTDAAARRCGIGKSLLSELLQRLKAAGVSRVTADYVLPPQEAEAMDALLMKNGFSRPRRRSSVFLADTKHFHDNRWVSGAFSAGYRTPPSVCSFADLTAEALAEVENAYINPVLSPKGLKDSAVPEMSVALLADGRVCAYLLAGESEDGTCVLLAALRREGAPADALFVLLRELLNRCYYRMGGDFLLCFSTLSERAERLAFRLTDGHATVYEEHVCYCSRM